MPVLNAEFETDTSGWQASGAGATITRQTTTFHAGAASALIATGGAVNQGAYATMTGDAPQTSTWDWSAYVQAHAGGDVGRMIQLVLAGTGGSTETFFSTATPLAAGWVLVVKTATFVNAGHTAALCEVTQQDAGATFNVDVDSCVYARHVTYLPSADPLVTGLWFAGVPAGNHSQPSDATTAALIASGVYVGA